MDLHLRPNVDRSTLSFSGISLSKGDCSSALEFFSVLTFPINRRGFELTPADMECTGTGTC